MKLKALALATVVMVGLMANLANASIIRILKYDYEAIGHIETGDKEHYVVCDGCAPYAKLALATPQMTEDSPDIKVALLEQSEENPLLIDLAGEPGEMKNISLVKDGKKVCKVGNVKFSFDKYKLNRKESMKINTIASNLKKIDSPEVNVSGYTCNIGPLSYNNILAKKRATTVARLLSKKGVKISLIEGKGKCCSISDDKKLNRRVEINLIKEEGENCNE